MTLRPAASIVLERHAGPRRLQRRGLRLVDDVEDLLHLVGGLAEHERARDVRLIALDGAAVVDHDDRAFANRLRRHRAVGQRGVLADLHAGAAGEAEPPVSRREQAADLDSASCPAAAP